MLESAALSYVLETLKGPCLCPVHKTKTWLCQPTAATCMHKHTLFRSGQHGIMSVIAADVHLGAFREPRLPARIIHLFLLFLCIPFASTICCVSLQGYPELLVLFLFDHNLLQKIRSTWSVNHCGSAAKRLPVLLQVVMTRYAHASNKLLGIQIDAAINPGTVQSQPLVLQKRLYSTFAGTTTLQQALVHLTA